MDNRSGERPVCGVLALQGSFGCHERCLAGLEVPYREVRKPADLEGLSHLIIPGGESTTIHRLAAIYGLLDPIKAAIGNGVAVFGTCAGAILLGKGPEPPPRLEAVPVTVIRNAYGRQRESFSAEVSVRVLGRPFHAIFIRAPKIERPDAAAPELEILSAHGDDPVLVRYRRILLSTFHPELTEDDGIHRYFLLM